AGFSPAIAQENKTANPPAAKTAADKPADKSTDSSVVLDTFVVTGVRASLATAAEIKQNSIPLVDSVVAEDIGKFPDLTVADALQRVPGVQVGRGAGEVTTVLIRGLPNLATTLNGNEIFTGTSRGVALQDIPAELVSRVDVYKSTTPDKLEGGIAGLVDIRLRQPLDHEGLQFGASGRTIYGENADKMGWIASALVSNTVDTGSGGKFGILYAGAYQQRYFVDQTAFNYLFEPVTGIPTNVAPSGTLELPFTQGTLITPGDRKRYANNLAAQWRINSQVELYDNFLQTAYRDEHAVHFLIGFPRFGAYTAATINQGNVPYTTTSTNNFQLTSMQAFQQQTDGYQNILGAKWTGGDTKATLEYLYNWDSFKNQAFIVDTRFGPTGTGTYKFFYNDDSRANLSISGVDIADAKNFYLWGLFDNRDHSTSEQNGLKAEVEQAIRSGFFQKILGGIRWSDRDVRFRATSRNDISPAGATNGDRFAPTVPNTSTIPGFGTVSDGGPLDYYSTPHFYTASPDYLYSHKDSVRALFGLPAGDPPWNPTLGFTDKESVLAGYFDTRFATTVGGKTLDGSLGLSVVRTSQDLQGYLTNGAPLNSSKDATDVLPVLNTRLKMDDKLQFRFSAGRTITRPNFSDLNPAVTLNAPTTTGGAAGSGSGGNPFLETVTSDNYDLSLEYYFAKASYFSVTPFYRSIDGYVQSFAAAETIGGVTYNVVRPRNSGKGHLNGVEIVYQQFPEVLRGFGWMLNYTYIDGSTDAPDTSPGAPVGARVTKPYAQVAKNNYNAILVYENRGFSARVAYNERGEYTDTFDGPNAPGSPLRQIKVKPLGTMDVSVSYSFAQHFTVTLDATNVLKSEYHDYFYDASRYPRDTRAYDRTVELGVRYRY
ncbi:MAG TPA: TonB-dependent receptor, partial [Candidatus Didemnitutus sp.]|nr:TonB-dependent receptor [Candidatus Didemnitutus sp.]